MGLRGRFTLWFSLASLVAIAAAAVVTREVVATAFHRDFERTRRAAERDARRAIDGLTTAVARAVASLADGDRDVRGALFDLHTYGDVRPEVLAALQARAGGVMRGLGLDLLFVIDDRGRILAAPHSGVEGERDDTWRRLAATTHGAAFFAREPLARGGGTLRTELVVVAARTVTEGGRAVTVVGGRAVGDTLADAVRSEGRVAARMAARTGEGAPGAARSGRTLASDGVGATVAVHIADDRAPTGGGRLSIPLPGADGEPVAWLDIAVSDAELRRVQRRVTLAAVAIGAGALAVAVLLGFAVARGITRGLDDLVRGVQAAARGDLRHRVPAARADEIGAVAEAVNDMMRALEEANERLSVAQRIAAWQEIARRLAHEIKNPLTPIQMSVETLRKARARQHPAFDDLFDESTRTVLDEVKRLERIVSEFSQFARLPKPQFARVDVNDIVRAALALYRGAAPVDADLAPDLPPVCADRDQLAQVVLNLVENARDAACGGGRDGSVRVSTAPDSAGGVLLAVDDDGPGVPDDLRARLFTPYFTTKQRTGGTGLGLAIAHRIVTEHGGSISVGRSPLGGARFTVVLPPADDGNGPAAP
ncbi:MAG: HAMP domain-containing protein [Deltaproteobacteria bacterium]|nr:MAG: HAMP domain-containing protein [Deltaproteobacteria bacterium]